MGIIPRVRNGSWTLCAVATGVLTAFASLGAVGCGSPTAPQLSPKAKSQMQRRLDDVRTGARSRDKAKALSALSGFSRLVSRESRAGHLSPAEARALKTGVAQARRRIELEIEPPTPTVAPTPPPAPSRAPETNKRGPKKASPAKSKGPKGKGKG